MLKNTFQCGALFCVFVTTLAAQDTTPIYTQHQVTDTSRESVDFPKYTVFVGGSYFRTHESGAEASQVFGVPDFLIDRRNLNFNLYGWNATVTENVNRWLGADFDFSGLYGLPIPAFLCSASSPSNGASCFTTTPVPATVITKIHAFTFGPRFSMRRFGRVVPFAHVRLGVAHLIENIEGSSIFLPTGDLLRNHTEASDTAFVVSPGAGLDFTLSRRIAIRFEGDYFMTRFYNERQDNLRASAGLVFQFGKP